MKDNLPLDSVQLFALAGGASFVFAIFDKLNTPVWLSLVCSFIFFIIGLMYWSLIIYWRNRKNRFKISSDREAENSVMHIKHANEFILVTHFSNTVPSKRYRDIMKNKIGEGVQVTRIVPIDIDKTKEEYKWLAEYENIGGYKEIQVNQKTPFDITLVDNEKLVLYFPVGTDTDYFTKALAFENAEVATLFKTYFEKIKHL